MVNQFYVDPANDFSGALMGLGNVIKDYRLEQEQRGKVKAAQERMAEVQSALGEAFNSGDPNKVAEIAIKYPEAQKTVELLYGFKSADTKKNLLDTGRAVLSNKNNPQGALAALNQRIEYLNQQGADPSHTMAARDELQRRIEAGEDTADFFKNAEMGFASIASPQEWKAYSGEAEGQKTPSSVLETEWFLRQPKAVQDEHLKLKRKTDPTMAEKLAYAQEVSNIKVNEFGEKTKSAQDIKLATEPEIAKAKQVAIDAAKKLNKQQGQMSKIEDADRLYKSLGNTDLDIIYGRGEKWYPEVLRSQKGVDIMAQRDQLVGMLNLAARGELQGQGSITEGEGAAVLAAATTLANPNVSPEEARKALDLAMKKIYGGAGKSFTPDQGGSGQGAATTGITENTNQGWQIRPLD